MTLHERVEHLLDAPVPSARFNDFVNDQSRGRKRILKRSGYGRYCLRQWKCPLLERVECGPIVCAIEIVSRDA
jgi:hypothetical protein